ncbi:MAG: hypothetical protein ABW076_03860 [Candidatus Thiodiazotropha sp.]
MPASLPKIDQAWFARAQAEGKTCRVTGIESHRVFEYQGLRWLVHEDGSIQSIMWRERPDYPVFEYVRGMLCALLFHPGPRRILNLGLGAATLERYLLKHLPEANLTSVEPDPDIRRLAQECFDLPDTHPVVRQSAQAYLRHTQETFDIVFCDIHARPGERDPLQEEAFLDKLGNALAPHGVVTFNLLPVTERDIVTQLMRIRQHLPHISLFDVPEQQNLVLFGSREPLPERETLRKRARGISLYQSSTAESLVEHFIWLPQAR